MKVHECENMDRDMMIKRIEWYDEYRWLLIDKYRDSDESVTFIKYCPYCGVELDDK